MGIAVKKQKINKEKNEKKKQKLAKESKKHYKQMRKSKE